jgi:hypothetical protein
VLKERGEPAADRGERAMRFQAPVDPGEETPTLAAGPEKSLEEIEEMHLRDSFWTV